jgi:hypothetical protein
LKKLRASYILPIRRRQIEPDAELSAYLHWLAAQIDVVVVDGSPPEVFAAHAEQWPADLTHLPPDPTLDSANGKVRGVLTGLRAARHERLVLADDDVRYDQPALTRIVALLDRAAIVRPQNYFDRLPWHARWDTARSLLNRATGGDWPGTLAVRRSLLLATGGYDGNVLFENLELVRTIRAAGGVEAVPLDLFVRRRPASTPHFWSQRVRQAYDEFARPVRLTISLLALPLTLALLVGRRWRTLLAGIAALIGLAELGRRRGDGRRVFPASTTLLAPAWVAERAVCIWLALGSRLLIGGVRYHGGVLRSAATPLRTLRQRHKAVRLRVERGELPSDENDQQRHDTNSRDLTSIAADVKESATQTATI